MKQPTFQRCKNIIRTPDGDTKYDSINKAKKQSRLLQTKNGQVLGNGSLRVVKKLTKIES